jgi:pilus assembly protein Flp/PilA
MIKKLINFFKDEEGASMVEYGLLVALIAVVCIVAVGYIGTNLNTVFTNVADHLGNTTGGGGS